MWNLGTAISDLREANNLSRKDLATKLNLSIRTIGNYETGSREPSIEIIKQLALVLNTSVEYLLTGHIHIDKDNEVITLKFKNGKKELFDVNLLQELIEELENNKINAESIIQELNSKK